MSISTNLVTLSVHDSYTFEGVEIAINPDVFFHGTAGSLGPSAQHTRNPSYASTSTPFGSAIAPPSAAVAGHVEYKITTTTVANSNHNIGGGGPNQDDGSTTGKSVDSSDNKLISAMFQPGDIIEIKVWDKKTHVHQDKHNKSSLQQSHKQQVHRRGGSMATVSTSSGGTMIKNNTHHHETILTRAASKLQQQQQIMTSSAASSVYHPLSDPNMKGSNNTKSSSNTTAASTTTSRPPIVPRNTSNATISSSAAVSPKYISTSPKTPPKTNYFSFKATPSNSTDAVVQQEDSLNTSNHLPSASLLPPKRTLDGSFSEEEVGVDVEEEASSSSVQDGSLMGVDVSLSSSVASQIPMPTTGMDGKDSLSGSGRNVDNGMVASGLTTVDSVDSDSMIVSELNSSRIESSGGGGGGGVGGGLHSRMSSLGSPGSNVATVVCDDDFLLPSSWNDPLEEIARTHTLRLSFVTSITAKSLMALKPGGRTKISMLKKVADLYELSTYDMVTITKFSKEEEAKVQASCQADFVTMTIKDQFMSRGEMYEFQKSFLGKWIYAGERLCTNDGIRGTVMEIRNKTEEFKSGFITEDTKITCRSRSARIIYLVQISMEMWDYASPYEGGEKHAQYGDGECEIYFDKYVSFMFKLFEEWKKLETSHSLTVVFFSRTFVNQSKSTNNTIRSSASDIFKLQKDVDGRLFEDHFKVVIENATRTELESLVTTIKKAFIRYPSEVGWALTKDYSRLPSFAAQGNILEAINTALNMLQLHFVDRDLHRCGNSIVVVSAGSGVFEVDKGLAGITKQRMMDNGIGSDMLSLGLPPLHVAPFMLFKESKGSHKNQSNDTDDFDNDWRAYFEIPHWMHLSFVNYDRVTPKRPDSDEAIPDDDVDDDGPKFKTFSNGFIYHEKDPFHRLHRTRIAKGTSVVKQQQKHLVLGRNFEDILEACRPRNKGSYSGGTPPALISQLKMFDLIGDKKSNEGSSAFDQQPSDTPREWNSIYLGNPKSSPCPSLSSSVDASGKFNRNESSSELSTYSTTPSSVFASNLSMILGRSPGNIHHGSPSLNHIQIQQHSSSDVPLEIISNDIGGGIRRSNSQGTIENIDEPPSRKGSRSDSIISSSGSNGSTSYTNGKILSLDAMREAMERFDEQLFLHESETRDVEVKRQNDVNKTLKPDRDNHDNIVSTAPSQSYSKSRIGGGIGAAISEFESKPTTTQAFPTNRRNESFTVTRLKKSMNAVSSNNLWSGHAFSRPSSLAYSFDDNHLGIGGIGLSVSRHAVSNLSHSSKPSLFLPMISGSSVPSKASFDDNFSPIRGSPPTVKEITVPLSNYESKKRSPHRERKIVPKSKAQQTITRVQRGPPPSHHNRRKQWVLNPFRQEDEEEVLAKRTHNSRRWSHVFPEGEIEFKRHAGPNWKSLCQPAILPVTIDVHPTPQELNDQSKYSFNHYQLNLDAMDLTYYTSHSELLMEMVRQRIVQDFQLVPQSVLDRNRKEADHGLEITKQRTLPLDTKINNYDANVGASGRIKGSTPTNANDKIQHVLSMGHRFHIISCNPTSDCVDVVQYLAKNAYNNEYNTFTYNYNIWMPATQRYLKVSQTFQRFPEEYPWNRLDNLICGDTDKTLDDQTKYRRIAFCIIPDHFSNESGEDALLKKIHRFIEFLEKIAKKDLNIQVVSSGQNSRSVEKIAPKDNQMKFIIHNRKKDKYEWIEVAASAIFDTRKSFRIIFKWLVSSAIKVDAQVQALQRRCSQYGLQLVEVPEISVRSNVFLNPLRYPESISVPTPEKAIEIENALVHKFRFCDDGKYPVFPKDAEKIFGVKLAVNSRASAWKRVLAQQYIHRSGTLFVRLLRDIQQQSVTFIFIENRRLIGNSKQMLDSARCIFGEINQFISDLCKLDVAT